MRKFFAITAVGKDRPGIVAGVSKALFELEANIEDSSMTILKSEFTMILIISTAQETKTTDFENHFKELTNKMGLFISVKELGADEIHSKKHYSGVPYVMSVIGTDKPGIVYKISELLASKGINITDLNTKVVPGERTPVYTMILEVDVPEYVDINLLEEEISVIEKEMAIDISIKEIEVLQL
jgi:glycine cleavage system transcriptional repressor